MAILNTLLLSMYPVIIRKKLIPTRATKKVLDLVVITCSFLIKNAFIFLCSLPSFQCSMSNVSLFHQWFWKNIHLPLLSILQLIQIFFRTNMSLDLRLDDSQRVPNLANRATFSTISTSISLNFSLPKAPMCAGELSSWKMFFLFCNVELFLWFFSLNCSRKYAWNSADLILPFSRQPIIYLSRQL